MELQEFQQRKEEKAKNQQEELFLIDLEREREKRDKTGRTVQAKMVSVSLWYDFGVINSMCS